jgi:glycosyltransferase involved in cell wall biosynthesis
MYPYPTLSIITPSLNHGRFIEQTILSVLAQGYPNLQYIVIDGGSTDGTIAILRRYSQQLTWLSEPDHGQAAAINKGLRLATGDIVAFLNSDDLYEPGALTAVGHFLASNPRAAWLSGLCVNIDESGSEIRPRTYLYKKFWLLLNSGLALKVLNYISQPATFWRRSIISEIGYLNEQLHYTMDYDYWLRLRKRHRLHVMNRDLARFRLHPSSKSGSTFHAQFDEELAVAERHCSGLPVLLHRVYHRFIIEVYKRTAS